MSSIVIRIMFSLIFPSVFIVLYLLDVSAKTIFLSLIVMYVFSIVMFFVSKERNGAIYRILSLKYRAQKY